MFVCRPNENKRTGSGRGNWGRPGEEAAQELDALKDQEKGEEGKENAAPTSAEGEKAAPVEEKKEPEVGYFANF
jgi:plasminogen activator inhibitor 1 RNA-binding protein